MFNLKIALRNLWKNRTYSGVNIIGLGISLSCCIAIGVFIWSEWSYDRFHANYGRIYRVTEDQLQDKQWYKVAVTPGLLAEELRKANPEIETTARISRWQGLVKTSDKTMVVSDMLLADHGFLEMFSLKLLKGELGSALKNADAAIITASMAETLYGPDWGNNPRIIGSVFNYNKDKDFRIAAVVDDLPENSSIGFKMILPLQWLLDTDPWSSKWNSNNFHTYLLLRKGADAKALSARIEGALKPFVKDTQDKLGLQPFSEQYLYSKFDFNTDWGKRSDIKYTRIFFGIGLLLLLIACINFVNLTTARAVKRSMEVGIRKVTGASRGQLVRQFLTESLIFVLIAGALALFVFRLASPWLQAYSGSSFYKDIFSPQPLLVLALALVLLGLVAGAYPAWMMSSFDPMNGMRYLRLPKGRARIRKVLVVFQFAVSAILIVCTLFMNRQLNYIRQKDLGFNSEQLVHVGLGGEMMNKSFLLKQELLKSSSIVSASPSTMSLVNVDNSSYLEWPGQKEDEKFLITHANTDPDFIRTAGLKLISGVDFSSQRTNDTSNYILNESAVKKLGLNEQTVLGKELIFWGHKGKVIGVVKDFHFKPLSSGIEPFILRYQPEDRYFRILVKTAAGRTAEALEHIKSTYAKFDQDGPANYSFVNELVEEQYKKDRLVAGLIMLFSILAILIACLGLFGLTAYSVEQRVKEIGVRKVLGASVSSIISIFVKEQLQVVALGSVLAVPVALYVVRSWLENFAYRIGIDWTLFVLSCMAVVTVAALTVSLMTLGAARAKPVEALRN